MSKSKNATRPVRLRPYAPERALQVLLLFNDPLYGNERVDKAGALGRPIARGVQSTVGALLKMGGVEVVGTGGEALVIRDSEASVLKIYYSRQLAQKKRQVQEHLRIATAYLGEAVPDSEVSTATIMGRKWIVQQQEHVPPYTDIKHCDDALLHALGSKLGDFLTGAEEMRRSEGLEVDFYGRGNVGVVDGQVKLVDTSLADPEVMARLRAAQPEFEVTMNNIANIATQNCSQLI